MTTSNERERQAWDQQPGESDKLYAYFMKWLALSDRNMVKAAEPLGVSHARLLTLSSRNKWKSRAAAYDQHQAREIAEETARERRLAARAIAQDIRETAQARLKYTPDIRDPAGVQKLAAALKAITPSLDDPAPTQTVKVDIEGLYTAVRLREQQHEEDEEDDDE